MPRYYFHKDEETGESGLTQVDVSQYSKMDVPKPSAPELPGGEDELITVHECAVENCGRAFKKAMLMARHFNSSHSDLKDDKDSWREFHRKVQI